MNDRELMGDPIPMRKLNIISVLASLARHLTLVRLRWRFLREVLRRGEDQPPG